MTYELEYESRFLFEKRTEMYGWYCSGASQKKIVNCAKSDLQGRALPDLKRCGS